MHDNFLDCFYVLDSEAQSMRVTVPCMLAAEALAARRLTQADGDAPRRTALARFFAENLAPAAGGLERAVIEGSESVADTALV